jgi:hypothetical protein
MVDHLLGEATDTLVLALRQDQPASQDLVIVRLGRGGDEGLAGRRPLGGVAQTDVNVRATPSAKDRNRVMGAHPVLRRW